MSFGTGRFGTGRFGTSTRRIRNPENSLGPAPLTTGTLWERAAHSGGVKLVHEVTITVPGGQPAELTVDGDGVLEVTQSLDKGSRFSANVSIIPEYGQDTENLIRTPGARFHIRGGFHFGGTMYEWKDFGVYELAQAPEVTRASTLQLTLLDLWNVLEQYRFLDPREFFTGISIQEAIIRLVREVMPDVEIVSRTDRNPLLSEDIEIDRSRTDALNALALDGDFSIYFDRSGRFTIADTTGPQTLSAVFTDGKNATIVDLSHQVTYSRMYNAIRVEPNESAGFDPHTVHIADVNDPRHRSKIGVRPAFWRTAIPTLGARINGATTRLANHVGAGMKFSLATWARGDLDVGQWVTALEAATWAEPMRVRTGLIDELVYSLLTAQTKITARSRYDLDVEGDEEDPEE